MRVCSSHGQSPRRRHVTSLAHHLGAAAMGLGPGEQGRETAEATPRGAPRAAAMPHRERAKTPCQRDPPGRELERKQQKQGLFYGVWALGSRALRVRGPGPGTRDVGGWRVLKSTLRGSLLTCASKGPSTTSYGSFPRCRPMCQCACWGTTVTWASTESSCPTMCATSSTTWTGGWGSPC